MSRLNHLSVNLGPRQITGLSWKYMMGTKHRSTVHVPPFPTLQLTVTVETQGRKLDYLKCQIVIEFYICSTLKVKY